MAEDADRARGRLREPGRAVDQVVHAGVVGTQEPEELAGLDIQRDTAKRLDPGQVALEELLDVEGVVSDEGQSPARHSSSCMGECSRNTSQ